MNSLVKELIQGLLPEEDENKKTVALFGDGVAIFGGGFKPPTKGHFEVVKTALDQNPEIDEFLILIGRGVRDGITQEDSFKIWNIYKNYLPSKVKIINSVKAPIGAIYEYAKKHPEEEVLWIIGAREGNESDFIDISSRTKSITKYPNLELRTIITNGGVSGTAARNAAKISPQKLNQFLPDFLSLQEKNTIFTILNNDISEKLNEIGDASASPYPYTPDGWVDPPNFRYSFKTDSGIEYRVYIEPLDPYGSLEEYSISFAAKGTGKDDWWGFDTVHSKGELYKVMSTVVATIKDFLKINPNVTSLSFSPTKKSGEDYIDNQRSRLYSAFIKRQIPNAKVTSDEEDRLITIKLSKKFKKSLQDKEEELNEIGDASATPYPYKLENTGNLDYRYLFTTTSKIQYKVDIDALAPTLQHYSIAFASKSPEENQYWDYQAVHSKGELYKVMSTVVAIIKDFLKLNPEVTKLTFSPSSKDGEGGLDNQRAKLYTTFITSQIKDAHIEKSYRNKEFTIILPSNFTKDSQNKEEELNEIGDANAEPYIININAKKIKTQSFSFKTDPFKVKDENGKEKEVPGTEYEVYLFRNGYRSREKFQNKGESYELGFAAKSYKDLDYNYNVTNEGNMFRVMATIVKIIKFFLKENPQVVEISFQPSPKTGEDNLDNKRAKLYMAYITKHLPGNKVELNSNNNTIYIQVSKEKKINEIGDASAEPYNIRNDSNRMFFFKTDPITKKDENGNEEEIDGTDYIVIFRKNSFLSRNGNLSFELSFEAKSFNDDEFSFKTVNEGNMFRVMATIVKIVKHFIKSTPEATEIFFSPYPKKGETKLDNKRAKLYMAYIAKHLPDGVEVTDVVSPDYGMNTLHIKLPKKEELTEVNYTKPKFGFEWEEAIRYPEFQEMGRREWIKKARSGYSTNYSKIKDVLGNVDLNFKNLERPKQKRFQSAFHQGNIEMPIVVKFSDNDYDLVAGNTRLSGLIKNGIDPEVWVVDISDLQENYADGKVLNENASYSQHIDIKQQIKELTQYMLDKGMNIKPLPKVIFKHGNTTNAKDFFGKTAYYNPNDKSIVLYTEGRHPKDIVRSFSHEMIHHIQNLEGRLGNITTTNTMEDDHLDKIEQEANLGGTTTFRNWTDSLNGDFKLKIQKHIKEYKQYVLNELFEKDLPIINKTSKNTYIVSNGEDIDAEYYFRLEIPERDLWTLNWMFTPENENKSPEAWKQVTATSFKVLEDWLKTNSPKSIHISGNTNTKTKLYKTYVDKLETLLNNKYRIDNSDVDKVVLRSIEETSQLSIKKRMESLNESYKQALNYYQNGNLNSKSRIEQWASIKKLIERETLKEVYGLVKNLLPQEKFAQETGQDYIQQALNNIPQRDKYDTKNYKVVTLSLDKVKPTQFGEDYINPSSEYEAEQYKKYLEGKIEVEDLRKEDFYPIIVDKNTMEVIDGNHRHAVHTILNIPKIKAILISKKIQNENKKKDLFGLNEYIQELASLDKDKIKVYLDMDGVLADFDKRFRDLAGMLPSEFESKYGKNAFWDFIDEGNNKVKFWVGIPVMDGAKQLIDWASQYKYSLLTAPSNKKQSLIGKSLWVKKHTGDLFPTTPFINFKRAKNKHLVKPDLQPTDILIDDREDTIERWNNAGGTGIHYRNVSQVLNDLAKLGL